MLKLIKKFANLAGIQINISHDKLNALLDKLQSQHAQNDKLNPALLKAMLEPMCPRKIGVPEGAKCTKCGSDKIHRIWAPSWGRFGGRIECTECGYKESAMAHICKSCISIEPLEIK
jgi:hypothetical protein